MHRNKGSEVVPNWTGPWVHKHCRNASPLLSFPPLVRSRGLYSAALNAAARPAFHLQSCPELRNFSEHLKPVTEAKMHKVVVSRRWAAASMIQTFSPPLVTVMSVLA